MIEFRLFILNSAPVSTTATTLALKSHLEIVLNPSLIRLGFVWAKKTRPEAEAITTLGMILAAISQPTAKVAKRRPPYFSIFLVQHSIRNPRCRSAGKTRSSKTSELYAARLPPLLARLNSRPFSW